MPSFLPGGIIWVYVVGVAFILAALSFVFNKQVKLAAWLLAIMLFIFVLMVHIPNYMDAFALHIASNAKTVG